MNARNRGLLHALGKTKLTVEELDVQNNPIAIDQDHPDITKDLSLVEYAELHGMMEQQIIWVDELGEPPPAGDAAINGVTGIVATPELATESLGDHWANFKNRFADPLSNEDAFVDELLERFKKLNDVVRSSSEKPVGEVPISIFNSYATLFQLGPKTIQNPTQLQAALEYLSKLAEVFDKDWLPSSAKEIKYTTDYLIGGATNVNGAYQKAYVTSAACPSTRMEALCTHSATTKAGNGSQINYTRSDYFMGSFVVCKQEIKDYKGLKVKRGFEIFTRTDGNVSGENKLVGKVQTIPATRTEALKMIETCIKLLGSLNHAVEHLYQGELRMMLDKIRTFEDNHGNWRQYPAEERHKIATILSCACSTDDRAGFTHYVLSYMRRAMRATERYIEMSIKRAK